MEVFTAAVIASLFLTCFFLLACFIRFRSDEAPAGSGNGGMRIEELDASAEQKGGAVAEPKKDK